jgi:hypothetical protein
VNVYREEALSCSAIKGKRNVADEDGEEKIDVPPDEPRAADVALRVTRGQLPVAVKAFHGHLLVTIRITSA